jgi:hypothetical protein
VPDISSPDLRSSHNAVGSEAWYGSNSEVESHSAESPLYPDERTSSDRADWSVSCHGTNPLAREGAGRAIGRIAFGERDLVVTVMLSYGQAPLPERGSNAGPAKPRLEFIALRAHNSFCLRSRGHASNRANPGGQTVLLSPLRSTVFSDGLAASQGGQHYGKMRCMHANHGRMDLDGESSL